MNTELGIAAEAIFAAVVDLPPAEREAALLERCGARADLRAEVDALLLADAAAEQLRTTMDAEMDEGDAIGPFRLGPPIAHGGMGRVFVGERIAGGFTQRVAVKLVDARGREAVRRFESERQILAGLSHPHIVSLVDGGITDRGQPYLVMEYVEGVPFDEYCAAERPSLESRLRLCARVCSAVRYAHSRGVIHRDLKPANILVTADGAPKILDFGVAKLASGGASDMGETAPGLPAALTMNYASPEQLRGLPVTVASDIYSLGVVCHEMLLGSRPYDLQGLPLDDAIRRVRDSSAVLAQGRDDVARAIGRAMAFDPEQRFADSGEFQAALEACAAAAGARPAAPLRRNRSWLGLAAAAVLIAVAAAVYAWGPVNRANAVSPTATPRPTLAAAPPTTLPRPTAPRAITGTLTTAELEAQARDLRDRALSALDGGRAREAATLMLECVVIRRQLVARVPQDGLQRARLAWSLSFLARRQLDIGELVRAEANAVESVALSEPLAIRGSTQQSDLAYNLHVLGLVQRARGLALRACESFTRARSAHEASRPGLTDQFLTRFSFLDSEIPAALAPCR